MDDLEDPGAVVEIACNRDDEIRCEKQSIPERQSVNDYCSAIIRNDIPQWREGVMNKAKGMSRRQFVSTAAGVAAISSLAPKSVFAARAESSGSAALRSPR